MGSALPMGVRSKGRRRGPTPEADSGGALLERTENTLMTESSRAARDADPPDPHPDATGGYLTYIQTTVVSHHLDTTVEGFAAHLAAGLDRLRARIARDGHDSAIGGITVSLYAVDEALKPPQRRESLSGPFPAWVRAVEVECTATVVLGARRPV